jgi:hypothetical protein
MDEKPTLLSVETGDHLKWLVAEAANEAFELIVVHYSESENGSFDELTKRVPYFVGALAYRGGPACHAKMAEQQLVPYTSVIAGGTPVLINLHPKVWSGVQAV